MKADWRILCNIKSPVKKLILQTRRRMVGRCANDRLAGALVDEESAPEYLFMEFGERRQPRVEFFFATYNRLGGKDFKVLGWGRLRKLGKSSGTAKLNHHKNGWLLD